MRSWGFDTYLRRVRSLSKDTFTPRKVIPRKRWLHSDMTEKLLTGTLSINTNKQTIRHSPSTADSRRAVISYWQKNVHYVLVNCQWICQLMAHLNFQIGYMLAIPEAAVKVPITAEDNYHIEGLEFLVGILNLILVAGKPYSEVIKLFSCSTQLIIKFKLLINTEMTKINRNSRFKPVIYPAYKC